MRPKLCQNESPMSFTWVPFYREVAERVLEYEDRQDELLALLREMKADGLNTILLTDKDSDNNITSLTEIDPFTFFATLNRGITDVNRQSICEFLKKKWQLDSAIPLDFDGVPLVNTRSSWFFAYQHKRESDDIKKLWRLVRAALANDVDKIAPDIWSEALNVKEVGVAKLTMGLFWIAPQKFLTLDSNTVGYVHNAGIEIENADLHKKKLKIERYNEILDEIHRRLGNDNLQISLDAYDKEKEAVENDYTWVPFYREVAARVLEYEDDPAELLEVLREMKAANLPTVPLEHDQPTLTPLTTIDPFTFMANFGRTMEPSCFAVCAWIRKKWDIEAAVPTDFSGRHAVQSSYRGSWFFGALAERAEGDTDYLWQLAKQAYNGDIDALDAALVAQCLAWPNLRMKKLSIGLSWINPEAFLPLSGRLLLYANSLDIPFQQSALLAGDLDQYRALMNGASQIEPNNAAFVKAAYQAQPDDEDEDEEITELPNFPLNQILYGPPGTGKTYSTIQRAVEIIDGVKLPHDEAKLRFEALRKTGQIEFVTFHQSFSYEEFIEGLRPILDEDGDGQARYEVRDGVLKKLALRAQSAMHVDNSPLDFEAAWEELKRLVQNGEVSRVAGRTSQSLHELVFEGDKLWGENVLSEKENRFFSTSKQAQQKAWDMLPSGSDIKSTDFNRVEVAGKGNDPFGAVTCNLLRKISIENAEQTELETAPRHVLIVDEINRGNISKILGELITLLEDDKRLGATGELRVQLPVSGDHFALPPNLYLLGTMNTADKSLALLDIALRRRFDFIEMAPDAKLFPDFARDVLTQLNLRLEAALDREHRIGHAYFIGRTPAQCNAVFRAKIIPLLQEFFYHDWETLRAVLGESGDKEGAFIKKLVAPQGMKARTKWRWWFDADGAAEFDYVDELRENYKTV